jgi:hypothetical protein
MKQEAKAKFSLKVNIVQNEEFWRTAKYVQDRRFLETMPVEYDLKIESLT